MAIRKKSRSSRKKIVGKLESKSLFPLCLVKLTNKDVLLGRGSGVARHPGNKMFRGLVVKYKEVYANAKRSDKTNIAAHVVQAVMEQNGRFVEQVQGNPSKFTIVHDRRAIEKTAQALRERKWNLEGFDRHNDDLNPEVDAATTKQRPGYYSSKTTMTLTSGQKASSAIHRTKPKIPKCPMKKSTKTSPKRKRWSSKRKRKGKKTKSSQTMDSKVVRIPTPIALSKVALVTPPSSPTMVDCEQDLPQSLDEGYETAMSVKRRLVFHDDLLDTHYHNSKCSFETQDESIDVGRNDDRLVALLTDDAFSPLDYNATAPNISHDLIMPDGDWLNGILTEELHSFDFPPLESNDENDFDTVNMVFQYCVRNGYLD